MTRITVALFNLRAGGRTLTGGYDFTGLQAALAQTSEAPALLLFCEGRDYASNGAAALHAAAEALADQCGVPYAAELGVNSRGPLPPAIFYNPRLLQLRQWWNGHDPDTFDDLRNVARFAVRDSSTSAYARREFLTFVHHFDFRSGDIRLQEAQRLARFGRERLPVVGGGDLNATGSGPHLPRRDWDTVPFPHRTEKGLRLPDGRWGPDTRALDHLIGAWDPATSSRRDGSGLHAIAELAWHADPAAPITATVNDGVDAGGGLLIDWLLANQRAADGYQPGSYTVHIPPTPPYPSDHRLITATFDL